MGTVATHTEPQEEARLEREGGGWTAASPLPSPSADFVANFAQEVMQRQLPLSVEGIRQPGSRTIWLQQGLRLGSALHVMLFLENLIRAFLIFNGLRSPHYQRA